MRFSFPQISFSFSMLNLLAFLFSFRKVSLFGCETVLRFFFLLDKYLFLDALRNSDFICVLDRTKTKNILKYLFVLFCYLGTLVSLITDYRARLEKILSISKNILLDTLYS